MMTAVRPPRRAAGNVVDLPDRRDRRQPQPGARRNAGVAPLVYWSPGYGPTGTAVARVANGTGYDATIAQTWRMHLAGAIDEAEAARQDLVLRRLRYAPGEGREAWA